MQVNDLKIQLQVRRNVTYNCVFKRVMCNEWFTSWQVVTLGRESCTELELTTTATTNNNRDLQIRVRVRD